MDTQKRKTPIVLIEGLDLAGKTSACRQLATRLKCCPEHHRNAFAHDNPLHIVADRLRCEDGLDSTYLGHAYLAAAALDLRMLKPPVRPRIQESMIALRSLAHYRARRETVLADGFARLLDDPAYPEIAGAVVLTASIEARQRRLEMRRSEAPHEVAPDDIAVVRTPALFLKMEEIIIREAVKRYRTTVIDTSAMTKDDVVDELLCRLDGVLQ